MTTPISSALPLNASALPPYATMLGFTRYVARTGPAKATFVGGLRRQRERRSGFNPHGQLVKALKADIAFRTGGGPPAARPSTPICAPDDCGSSTVIDVPTARDSEKKSQRIKAIVPVSTMRAGTATAGWDCRTRRLVCVY